MLQKIIQLFSKKNSLNGNDIRPHAKECVINHSSELFRNAEELKELGEQYFKNRNIVQAEIYYNQSLAVDTNQFEIYKSLGVSQYYQGNLEEAIKLYDKALALKPEYPEALSNRGLALHDLKKFEEALIFLDQAIALKSDFAFAHNNRGMVLKKLGKLEDSLASYDCAISLKPDYPEAYNNRGTVLRELNRFDEELASYDHAIALKPDYAEAFFNRGHVLVRLKKLNEAFMSYSNAILLIPNHEIFYGYWIEVKKMLCDWSNYEQDLSVLEEKVNVKKSAIAPLIVLALSDSPLLQQKAAELFVQTKFPANNALPSIARYPNQDKIRIGYFSADFHNHAVSFLTAELFEMHDKSRFELVAISFSSIQDEMTQRLAYAFDQFVDASKQSDLDVVLMARNMRIDIAIDLGGFTAGCRPEIFAMRVAPIQVNYLGYPGTMGADYMDYVIADNTIIPSSHQQYYTEKVVYLPSFQVNDTKRTISDRKFSREELGLPPTSFVFCSFNNITKITPFIFDSWMRILKQVDGSVLWLLDESPAAVNNLRKEAVSRGVDSSRLIFAKRLPLPEYLARYRMADLFLDTLPYNAGTTASDALWVGLPVLTLMGETFAGRMAASLLNAIHLPELITTTQEKYEACAINLATQPDKLKDIKQKLANNRLSTPLFDIEYFTRNIESAYIQMYERYQAGLGPDHINVMVSR